MASLSRHFRSSLRLTPALLVAVPASTLIARTYTLDLNADLPAVQRGHLDLGSTAPDGRSITANSFYIEQNGRPFMPVIGEFHFSRYPAEEWETELLKMKAGGINTVATYVFWNMHERTEGNFDWSGDLDLHRFIETTKRVGLQMILRVGPFDHGEIRNGGLPDWLYGRAFEIRSNDPAYLKVVERLYTAIAQQVRGLLFKDGGPIIGIQIENEYQHSAAPWEIRYAGSPKEFTVASRDVEVTHGGVSVSDIKNKNAEYGSDHMLNLKQIAKRCGLDAPLYTATGWGNAAIIAKGSLPVTAAYPYPFWTPKATPSPFYLFADLHRHPDYAPVSFDPTQYPSLPAELGAGISTTYARRSYVPEDSVEPMIVRVLGSGSNGIGYYMYHGGANPVFDKFYDEDASGLPKINYDYQAPLGQYGRAKDHYFSLRLLHHFLASYGERLAPLGSILSEENASITATDTSTLRFAARAAKGSGFIFICNFQDHVETHDIKDVALSLRAATRTVTIPSRGSLTVKRDLAAVLPVNLDLDGVPLRSATVQPLSILRSKDGISRYVFFSIDGFPPELVFEKGAVSETENCQVQIENGATIVNGPSDRCFAFKIDGKPILIVPRKLALDAVNIGEGRLLFSDSTAFVRDDNVVLHVSKSERADVFVYPAISGDLQVAGAGQQTIEPQSRTMSGIRLIFEPVKYSASWREITSRRYALKVDSPLGALHDVFLQVDYTGDTGMAFVDGQMIDDHFYSGRPWEIGLRSFIPKIEGKEIVFIFQSMKADATYLDDIPTRFRPAFTDSKKELLEVRGVKFTPEYEATLKFPSN